MRAQLCFCVARRELLADLVGILGGRELAPVDDPDGGLRAHHADFRLRPREHVVGAEIL